MFRLQPLVRNLPKITLHQIIPKQTLRLSPHFPQMPKTPDLIYMPHIVRWVKSKLKFKYLKIKWDPEFSEGAFIYGTSRAVCKITEIISKGNSEQLEELMTVSARIKLQDDINYRLTPLQKKFIQIKPQDIKILVPVNIGFTRNGHEKKCRVGLRVLALKWQETRSDKYKLVLVALQTEFLRDYAEGVTPDWIISNFQILDCTMLTETTPAQ